MLCLYLVHQSDCCSGLHMSGIWFLGMVLFRSTNMHPSEGSLSAHRYKVAHLLNPGSVDSPQINHVDILLKWSQLYLRLFLDCNLLYSAKLPSNISQISRWRRIDPLVPVLQDAVSGSADTAVGDRDRP